MSEDRWHFTCHHGYRAIGRYGGLVMPAASHHPAEVAGLEPAHRLLALLAWFTDQPTVDDPDALGLGSSALRCDRTTHRYRVLEPWAVVPWSGLRPWFLLELAKVHTRPHAWLGDLEAFGKPEQWWVASGAVRVAYAPESPTEG